MSELPPPGHRMENPEDRFERGQIVRPIEEIRQMRPRLTTLTVRQARRSRGWCSGCAARLEAAGRHRFHDDATRIKAGGLYAGTQEVSSWLCLNCVEAIPSD